MLRGLDSFARQMLGKITDRFGARSEAPSSAGLSDASHSIGTAVADTAGAGTTVAGTASVSRAAANAPIEHDLPTGPTWCVDSVHPEADRSTVVGWYIRPLTSSVQIEVNGERFDPVEFDRPDLAGLILAGEGNVVTGFQVHAGLHFEEGFSLNVLIDGDVIERLQSWYPPESLYGPIPDGPLRARVHGGDVLPSFLVEGYSAYRRLDALLDDVATKAAGSELRLLDWGCGCGRVARYFVSDGGYAVTGTDIDSDNAGWCAEHLDGTFTAIPSRPPTGLELGSFDAIIGVSVMTHLDLELQLEWLTHLRSLLVPAGVALLTSHGWATARRTGVGPAVLDAMATSGFGDAGENPDIPESVVEVGYYRNVYNTHDHIREHWSTVMEVESIRPALIGHHQDVVVLRRTV